LERTYGHRKDGFELLAEETPDRLSLACQPMVASPFSGLLYVACACAASGAPPDGITYDNASYPVDLPVIATASTDRRWVATSFTNLTGNVWSNPESTCQRVDPERPLPVRAKIEWDVKMLIFPGMLDQVLQKVRLQRTSLK
jgi:hypothetical protein